MLRLQSITGLAFLIFLAWAFSENRRRTSIRILITGVGLQFILALILLKFPGSRTLFLWLNHIVQALGEATEAGTSLVFGYLGGAESPFKEKFPGASYVLAFRGLPLVLVISAISSLLFYWNVMPHIVRGFSWFLRRIMGIGGVEGVAISANIFVGMVESPLLVRPYLPTLSRSELFAMMASGMATIAGTVMFLYATILSPIVPGIMGHLLIASIISAPASITVAKLMVPETNAPTTAHVQISGEATSAMDAITKGTLAGMKLLLSIVAMLVVLVALVHLANLILGLLPDFYGTPITFQRLMGAIFAPITWLMGMPWSEAKVSGALMGTKTVLNELLAYVDLAGLPATALSDRSRLIMTYALCGFANFGSLGIMIGGMGAMAEERRPEIVGLGLKSIVAGTIATCMTGAMVGVLYP